MAVEDRRAHDRLTFFGALEQRPWAHDFYQVMRRVEGLYPGHPRVGESRRPVDDPVRLGQQADLSFAPANVSAVGWDAVGRPRIWVRFLGLFGTHGPMPTHLTAFVRSREYNENDPTLARFADLFHHRQLSLFYRAWRGAQPTASRDRRDDDRFMTYVGAFIGEAGPAWRRRQAIGDEAKRHFAGHLARASRNADGLIDILTEYFGVRFVLEPFVARWVALPADQRTRLGRAQHATLGAGAVLGRRVFDAQHHFDLRVGPLTLAEYQRFLPGGPWHRLLREWLRRYCDETFGIAAVLLLRAEEVPPLRLGGVRGVRAAGDAAGAGDAGGIGGIGGAAGIGGPRLGWTAWLGRRAGAAPAADLQLTLSQYVQ